jgi:hypothetical protein
MPTHQGPARPSAVCARDTLDCAPETGQFYEWHVRVMPAGARDNGRSCRTQACSRSAGRTQGS